MKHIRWQFLIVIFMIMGIIFFFSGQTGTESKSLSDEILRAIAEFLQWEHVPASNEVLFWGLSFRKMAHIFLYFLLGVFVFLSIRRIPLRPLIAAGVCYLLAVFDELHQLFVLGRGAYVRDTGIDAIGFGLAILIVWGISELYIGGSQHG